MTDISIDVHGEFRVGRILGTAWRIFAGNFLILFAVSAVISLPNLFLGPGQAGGKWWVPFLGIFVGLILYPIAEAVILYVAFQYLRGQPAPLGDALRKGLARFWPILGVATLAALGMGLGFLLLFVPGVILAVTWSVALPACVLEELGSTASLGRSQSLTKGYRWNIFGILLLLWIANSAGQLIIAAAFRGAFDSMGTNFFSFLWTSLWTGYYTSVLVVIYRDLRVAKDGVDIHQIAAVFD